MKIDGVFSGGGIRGFALIGAYQELEEKGYQFIRLAGTSAGSIIAGFIAAGYRSSEIYQLIDEVDLKDLLDDSPRYFPAFLNWLKVYWKLGLYKGDSLEAWLSEKLAQKGVRTFADLPPETLRVVASDLTNGQLIVLPDDLQPYGISPENFSVARAIRMSCSLPYFFQPAKLKTAKGTALIADGGILSNFPMWIFGQEGRKRPVIGIKLVPRDSDIQEKNIHNAIELFSALFKTMKDAHDARYISRKLEKNIVFIKTNGISLTEFELNDNEKRVLVELGREQTRRFLKNWSYG
ncbi:MULTISPECIES: patatin-like phospholipase family protein [Bacillus]|jgi:NTE family protein|uniref:patatin-like phospholipase family protein n=1 Tax=Bacillus TaxID=1386 RepID=UPI00065DC475|nr:patatin-like phospholipase family protein [Bacillus smithii]AKP47767.1 lysophospholipase-like family protein [Bacillus smithii]MED0659190.1 patatin-like phospholipase family protein [Bacillus smithii]MED4883333.1 patatin-like phospholipase family protein [Bacillus smithii]MED4927160.1 patatin-like phospholipase family protein [Bacillus smithii]